MEAVTDVKELGKTPISPDKPAGEDIRYDPLFEDIQSQIDRLSQATAGEQQVDWHRLVTLCFTVLSERSKDLLVAAYLSLALTKIHGMSGLAAGAGILGDMIETFWEDLFPPKKRLRGRINALDWWIDNMSAFLEGYAGDPVTPELMAELKDDLTTMDKALAERDGELPTLRPVLSILSRVPVLAPPEPEPAAPEPPAAPPAATTGQTSPAEGEAATTPPSAAATPRDGATAAAPGPFRSVDDIPAGTDYRTLIRMAQDILSRAAGPLLDAEPANPVGYLATRVAAWLTLNMPPHDDEGKTRIPPPDRMIKVSIEQLLATGKYVQAARASEARVTEFLFWLDMSRITASALRALGDDYATPLDIVERQTAFFLAKHPRLETLTFADGTPFADPETKTWLAGLTRSPAPPAAGDRGGDADMAEAVAEARGLAGKGQALKAVTLLQDRVAKASSGRARLMWRIALAELLGSIGKPEIAAPIVTQIVGDIDAFRVEEFDPELALKGLGAALAVLTATPEADNKVLAGQILSRVTRLDPAEGLRLGGLS